MPQCPFSASGWGFGGGGGGMDAGTSIVLSGCSFQKAEHFPTEQCTWAERRPTQGERGGYAPKEKAVAQQMPQDSRKQMYNKSPWRQETRLMQYPAMYMGTALLLPLLPPLPVSRQRLIGAGAGPDPGAHVGAASPLQGNPGNVRGRAMELNRGGIDLASR